MYWTVRRRPRARARAVGAIRATTMIEYELTEIDGDIEVVYMGERREGRGWRTG